MGTWTFSRPACSTIGTTANDRALFGSRMVESNTSPLMLSPGSPFTSFQPPWAISTETGGRISSHAACMRSLRLIAWGELHYSPRYLPSVEIWNAGLLPHVRDDSAAELW